MPKERGTSSTFLMFGKIGALAFASGYVLLAAVVSSTWLVAGAAAVGVVVHRLR